MRNSCLTRLGVLIGIGVLILAAAPLATASVSVGLTLNRSVYMQYETIYACITLRNDSGRALVFGKDPRLQGFVLFDIRDSRGRSVPKLGDAEISVTGLVLGPGEVKRMVIPLTKYYELDRPDDYVVHGFVSHNLLDHEYRSIDRMFRVETGVPVWQRTVGMPDLSGAPAPTTKSRTYSLRTLNESPGRFYYLVIEDDRSVYGVMRLGHIYGQERFQIEIDMLSRIHVLIPMSPKIYHYLSFSLDGTNTNNSYWKVTNTIPMLYRDPATGVVTRIGGEEAKPGIDFRDPVAGGITASQIGELNESGTAPAPPRNSGLVDIGKGAGK